MAPGTAQHVCDTGMIAAGSAICSVSATDRAEAYSVAAATYGSASAFVQGGGFLEGYGSSATARGSFSDTLTFYGGTGTGVLSILESVVSYGTGSLQFGNWDWHPATSVVKQSFTYGSAVTISLTAFATGNFDGAECDGGSLLVSKILESMTVLGSDGKPVKGLSYTDASGHAYNTSNAAFSSTPEPGAWVLAAIGVGLLCLAKRKLPAPQVCESSKN